MVEAFHPMTIIVLSMLVILGGLFLFEGISMGVNKGIKTAFAGLDFRNLRVKDGSGQLAPEVSATSELNQLRQDVGVLSEQLNAERNLRVELEKKLDRITATEDLVLKTAKQSSKVFDSMREATKKAQQFVEFATNEITSLTFRVEDLETQLGVFGQRSEPLAESIKSTPPAKGSDLEAYIEHEEYLMAQSTTDSEAMSPAEAPAEALEITPNAADENPAQPSRTKLRTSTARMGLPPALVKKLRDADIRNAKDLSEQSREDILAINGLSYGRLHRITKALGELGLSLKTSELEQAPSNSQ